ncbi:hypothetical protein CAOG_05785 [Capsaspora owczarzaki ATCC 30864]|uniref:EamA domain-containing protein n=1 Tax=Capsaspora owczarzaki (strain ATCC 30864) TaxID=595528 RepID=A0A0D2UJP3_CAPO3|nr:hypothetical protein CAOG_05785 [Capsaspora owczarzaki ATCC 30864]KJE95326.1 hypothetical protein CAOG_005785 [Capsaspora owczarzaki ATCC 30864]|eukprot:XP_004346458.2 hypothetical protein CAOG_05785 [Capsaspora owczarzaki ATCC 30864]
MAAVDRRYHHRHAHCGTVMVDRAWTYLTSSTPTTGLPCCQSHRPDHRSPHHDDDQQGDHTSTVATSKTSRSALGRARDRLNAWIDSQSAPDNAQAQPGQSDAAESARRRAAEIADNSGRPSGRKRRRKVDPWLGDVHVDSDLETVPTSQFQSSAQSDYSDTLPLSYDNAEHSMLDQDEEQDDQDGRDDYDDRMRSSHSHAQDKEHHHHHQKVPIHVWVILCLALVAVSSAGTAFKHIDDVTPFLRASWRLFVTSLVLLPPAVFQFARADASLRAQCLKPSALLAILFGGICLACHFGSWVWSLDNTTLAHSLLLVCMHPVIFVMGMLLLGRPVARGELLGTGIALAGTVLLLQDVRSDGEVTIPGDLVAFLGAVFFVGYLSCGKTLRRFMPVFIYAFSVTFVSSVVLGFIAIPAEDVSLFSASPSGSFGWAGLDYLPVIIYLSFGPGLVGHTGINYIVKFLPPLVVSISFLTEPLIGTVIGIAFGESNVPGAWTWCGGLVLMVGVVMNVTTGHAHSVRQAQRPKSLPSGISSHAISIAVSDGLEFQPLHEEDVEHDGEFEHSDAVPPAEQVSATKPNPW